MTRQGTRCVLCEHRLPTARLVGRASPSKTACGGSGDLGAPVVWAQFWASVTNTSFTNVGSERAIRAPYSEDDVTGGTADGLTVLDR